MILLPFNEMMIKMWNKLYLCTLTQSPPTRGPHDVNSMPSDWHVHLLTAHLHSSLGGSLIILIKCWQPRCPSPGNYQCATLYYHPLPRKASKYRMNKKTTPYLATAVKSDTTNTCQTCLRKFIITGN